MARYKEGILSAFHGKVGSVVGCSWRGVSYMRALPVKTKRKPTAAQLAARAKFKFVNEWLNPVSPYVMDFFRHEPQRHTGRQAAHSYIMRHAVKGQYPNFEIDYPSVLLSYGDLEKPLRVKVTPVAGEGVLFEWEAKAYISMGSISSYCCMVLIFPEKHTALMHRATCSLNEGRYLLPLNPHWQGFVAHAYLSVMSWNSDRVSDSVYAGRVEVGW